MPENKGPTIGIVTDRQVNSSGTLGPIRQFYVDGNLIPGVFEVAMSHNEDWPGSVVTVSIRTEQDVTLYGPVPAPGPVPPAPVLADPRVEARRLLELAERLIHGTHYGPPVAPNEHPKEQREARLAMAEAYASVAIGWAQVAE